jgi:hypothetical protein
MTYMTMEDAKCFRWITSFQACLQILCLRGSNGLPQVRVMTKKKSASSPKKSAGAMPAKGLAGVFAALEEILEPYREASPCPPLQAEILSSCNPSVRSQREAGMVSGDPHGQELRELPVDGGVHESGAEIAHPARTEETHAGKSLLQFQRGGSRAFPPANRFDRSRL